jgi:Salmonella virulence plasmid 65kDa B protein
MLGRTNVDAKGTGSLPVGSDTHAPAISLPKGGGAIRGIGEKFAVDPGTGTGTATTPIATSSGRPGFGPQPSLSYDSGAGNGAFGFGWTLNLPQISRGSEAARLLANLLFMASISPHSSRDADAGRSGE